MSKQKFDVFSFGLSEQRCLQLIYQSGGIKPYTVYRIFLKIFQGFHFFPSSSFIYYHFRKLAELGLIEPFSDDLWVCTDLGYQTLLHLRLIDDRLAQICNDFNEDEGIVC